MAIKQASVPYRSFLVCSWVGAGGGMRGGIWLASALAALLIVAVPLLGPWALAGAALCLALAMWAARRAPGWAAFASPLGLCGGAVGVASAVGALARHGAEAQYAVRATFGWLALALALVAVLGGALVIARPRLGAILLCGGGIGGFVAINLYNIDTAYAFAPIVCGAAAILALSPPTTPHGGTLYL